MVRPFGKLRTHHQRILLDFAIVPQPAPSLLIFDLRPSGPLIESLSDHRWTARVQARLVLAGQFTAAGLGYNRKAPSARFTPLSGRPASVRVCYTPLREVPNSARLFIRF